LLTRKLVFHVEHAGLAFEESVLVFHRYTVGLRKASGMWRKFANGREDGMGDCWK
jgi:hypothetical protein